MSDIEHINTELVKRIDTELEGVVFPDRRGRLLREAAEYIKKLEELRAKNQTLQD